MPDINGKGEYVVGIQRKIAINFALKPNRDKAFVEIKAGQ